MMTKEGSINIVTSMTHWVMWSNNGHSWKFEDIRAQYIKILTTKESTEKNKYVGIMYSVKQKSLIKFRQKFYI